MMMMIDWYRSFVFFWDFQWDTTGMLDDLHNFLNSCWILDTRNDNKNQSSTSNPSNNYTTTWENLCFLLACEQKKKKSTSHIPVVVESNTVSVPHPNEYSVVVSKTSARSRIIDWNICKYIEYTRIHSGAHILRDLCM